MDLVGRTSHREELNIRQTELDRINRRKKVSKQYTDEETGDTWSRSKAHRRQKT